MPYITANLYQMNIDERKLTNALLKTVSTEIQNAARAFLQEAGRVPIRTGFARGGFLNLEDALKSKITRFFSSVGKLFKKKATQIEKYYGIPKTPDNARQFSTPISSIFVVTKNQVSFEYEINIDYFNINDFFKNSRTPSSPWLSFTYGKAAFQNYLDRNLAAKIPKVFDFLTVTALSVSKNSASKGKTLGVS